jgi:hypothetical protein
METSLNETSLAHSLKKWPVGGAGVGATIGSHFVKVEDGDDT